MGNIFQRRIIKTMLRLDSVLLAIDNINNQDPHSITFNGVNYPKEVIYGQQMTLCLEKHWPDAGEFLQIAARAQHIKRWQLKREEFETGKVGYLNWRKAQALFHAQLTSSIMKDRGYSAAEIALTSTIIRKEKLKSNPDSQTLEDVACLVFLEHYLDAFAEKHSEEKIISILQKTWKKMSAPAHDIALTLAMPEHLSNLVTKALNP